MKKISDIETYRMKLYDSVIKESKTKKGDIDIPAAEKMLDKFRYEFLPNLVEKYSWYKKEGETGPGVQHIVDNHAHVHNSNMIDYNYEAEKEYKKTEEEVIAKYPKEFSLLEELNQKSENYMNKETTIGFVKVPFDQLPEFFSAKDVEDFIFMIDIQDNEKV